jgi:hypothetical protein
MADYSQQIADLNTAATICAKPEHQITEPVNGHNSTYPRWPEAWKACEVVWRNYLDMKTMDGDGAESDRQTVLIEAGRLSRF